MKLLFNTILIFLMILACHCTNPSGNKNGKVQAYNPDSSVRYAKIFSISLGQNFKIIHLRGRANSSDTTTNFVLYTAEKPLVNLKNTKYIKIPCKRITSLSSIYSSMLTVVGNADDIVAIENVDYYNNKEITTRFNKGLVLEVQKGPEIDREKMVHLYPDVVFAFGMGKQANEFDEKMEKAGIPLVVCIDHLEESPLARAEWIKFFAAFVDKDSIANAIFKDVERDYHQLRNLASSFHQCPTVFTELKYGDTWYMPGGKSYMAQLIKDAHACYLWAEDSARGSLPLSFETVYRQAANADYWLNVSMCKSKSQLLEQEKRYADFAAFKGNRIFNNNRYSNALNYSTYWETGMIFPNKILSDLIQLFHPGEANKPDSVLYYYTQLQ